MLDLLSYVGEAAVVGARGRSACGTWRAGVRRRARDRSRRGGARVAAAPAAGRRHRAAELAMDAGGHRGRAGNGRGIVMVMAGRSAALAALDDDAGGRVAILNPYDGMLFDRPRLTELFEFSFVLEQFKPKAQRRYGYFAHPILVGDRFVGLLDAELDKKKENLVVTAVHEFIELEPEEREMVDAEIGDLADWLGVPVQRAR
jgi:uncharacterized protein YcaQ